MFVYYEFFFQNQSVISRFSPFTNNITCFFYPNTQLHVGVEAIRGPELLFQPSMIGSCEAGLTETIEFVLKMFSVEDQLILANSVFLTGGCAKFPGIVQ